MQARSPDAASAEAELVARTPFFDDGSYGALVGRRFASRRDAAFHYLREGAEQGVPPNPIFHVPWYLSEHPGLGDGNPLLHYLGRDAHERTPHPMFDPRWYRDRNRDVVATGIDPLFHYLRYGGPEGRDPGPLFSTGAYLAANSGIDRARVNPLAHHLAQRGARPFEPLGRVVVLRRPRALDVLARGELRVRLDAGGERGWTLKGGAAVVVGRRWLIGEGLVPAGGKRTLVPVEVPPGGSFWLALDVAAPAEAGRHLLQLCLIPGDGVWPAADHRAGLTLVPVDVRHGTPRAATSRWNLPARPPRAVAEEEDAIRIGRPAVARSLADRMLDEDRATLTAGCGRPFSRGTRPVIRWIKGDGLDDPVTRAAIAAATRLFGNRVDYCLCTNGISGARARSLLAHAREPVELWPLTAADNPWLARRLAVAGCYPDRFGYWWKWFPERVRPAAPEWILDGDMVVTDAPSWFEAWCAGDDVLRVAQEDGRHWGGAYGAWRPQVDAALRLYSGLISLPPGYRYRAGFEAALADPGLRTGHDGRVHTDEQGVVAVAFQKAGAVPIPLHEFPFARAFDHRLDFGTTGDRGRAWGLHFGHAFRRRNLHFERFVAAGVIPDCDREPPGQERFRWLVNRGQWGDPGWSGNDACTARIVAAARPYAGRDVLEIGTSRGYLAAMLAALGCRVTTVDAADRGAAVNLADMGIEVVIADGADFLARGGRRFDLVVVDLHGNGPGTWARLWPLATAAVSPGGRLAVVNTHLWRMAAWREETGLRDIVERRTDGWDVEVFPEPLPGMAIWTRRPGA